MKDGEDVRSLVVAVTGEGCVVVWVGLVGDAEGMAALQVVLVAKCELRNNSAMEVARPCLIR